MKSQAHTLFSYLVWAVFFAALTGIVYYIYQHAGERMPSSLPTIIDTLQSAKNLGLAGEESEVCNFVFIGGQLKLSEKLVKRFVDIRNVEFFCEAPGCETVDNAMLISGRGRICARMENKTLKITWRR